MQFTWGSSSPLGNTSSSSSQLNRWEAHLRFPGLVALLLLMCLSIVCSFVLGYISGKNIGFEAALSSSLSNVARYSIVAPEDTKPVTAKDSDQIFAHLTEEMPIGGMPKEIEKLAEPKLETVAPVAKRVTEVEPKPKKVAVVEPKVVEKAPAEPVLAKLKTEVVKKEEPKVREEVEEISRAGITTDLVPKGWYVQVSAPRLLKDAESVASTLKSGGFEVLIERARVRGQEYYRILVGPESQEIYAKRLLDQVRREKIVASDPFVREVE